MNPRDAEIVRNAMRVSMARTLLVSVMPTDANRAALEETCTAIGKLQRATEDDEDRLTLKAAGKDS